MVEICVQRMIFFIGNAKVPRPHFFYFPLRAVEFIGGLGGASPMCPQLKSIQHLLLSFSSSTVLLWSDVLVTGTLAGATALLPERTRPMSYLPVAFDS